MSILSLALYGGSFDPIHEGHLQTARYLAAYFKFSQFIFLPCGSPALKPQCYASADDRLAMLELALRDYPEFQIDTRELQLQKTSYTIDTLKAYRKEYGDSISLSLIIGQDAFAGLMDWHEWRQILDFAHIINHQRPQQALAYPKALETYIQAHHSDQIQTILTTPKGKIFSLFAGNYPYSSTDIRYKLAHHMIPKGLAPKVLAYIQKHHIYAASKKKL